MFFVSSKLDHHKPSSEKVKWLDQVKTNFYTWNCTNISYITLLKLQHILWFGIIKSVTIMLFWKNSIFVVHPINNDKLIIENRKVQCFSFLRRNKIPNQVKNCYKSITEVWFLKNLVPMNLDYHIHFKDLCCIF